MSKVTMMQINELEQVLRLTVGLPLGMLIMSLPGASVKQFGIRKLTEWPS
jgi:hypothetical protein